MTYDRRAALLNPVGTQVDASARPAHRHTSDNLPQIEISYLHSSNAGQTALLEQLETEPAVVHEDRLRARRGQRLLDRPGPTNWTNFRDRQWLAQQRPKGVVAPALNHDAVGGLMGRLKDGAASGQFSPTLASAAWMRGVRIGLAQALFAAFASYRDEELRTVTVIYSGWTYNSQTLDGATAARIKGQFHQHLIRVGVTAVPGPLFAVLHGEFEPASGTYVLHYHLVTTVEKALALMRLPELIKGYCVTATGARPVRRSRVKDRFRQFSYLAKSFWPSRPVVVIDGRPKRVRKPRRIPEPFGTQVLLWLDRQRFTDLVLMNDVWSMRRGGSAVMPRLYFFVMGVG